MTAPSDGFVRAARFIGDFGSPFYDEERQRDVWNEASAFGFQLILTMTLLAATATIWLVGRPALFYVTGAVLVVGLSSGLTVQYAQRLGVDVLSPTRMNRARMVPVGLLVVALGAGVLSAGQGERSWSSVIGLLVGATVAGLAMWVLLRRSQRGGQG